MDGLRALIVDDEPLARRRLSRLLTGEGGVDVVGEAAEGQEALDAIRSLRPDVVFLDVQMPGLTGTEVVRALAGEEAPYLIFVTAFDSYGVEAFDLGAVDYLLKPFDADRLRRALARVRERRGGPRPGEADIVEALRRVEERQRSLARALAAGGADRILVRAGERLHFVATADIDWIEAEGNYVRLHTAIGSPLVRRTLASLEATLDPSRFLRVHRSAIVNVDAVDGLIADFNGAYTVRLRGGRELRLSRGYREAFLRRASGEESGSGEA